MTLQKNYFFLIISFCLVLNAHAQNKEEIEKLKSFAKVYGYVKYFYPGDEASALDWNKFAIYGVQEILSSKKENIFANTLDSLFQPIAPPVVFYSSKQEIKFDVNSIIPDKVSNFEVTYWQHTGVSTGMLSQSHETYSSIRVNRKFKIEYLDLDKQKQKTIKAVKRFPGDHKIGECIDKKIGSDLSCIIPLALYCDEKTTFPIAKINELSNRLSKINTDTINLNTMFADVIISWNVFQHFYPYFEVVKVDWEKELEIALTEVYNCKNENDFQILLQKFTAKLKDGHIRITKKNQKLFFPPIAWDFIEGKLIITNVCDAKLPIHIGDEVTSIDKINPKEYFDEIRSRISAATEGWMSYLAKRLSLTGSKDSELSIVINSMEIKLKRTVELNTPSCNFPFPERKSFNILDSNIVYINLDVINMKTIDSLFPAISKSNGLICDLRGYPNNNHDLLSYLLSQKDTSEKWMQIPQFIYPDHEKIEGYQYFGWSLKPKKPHIKCKVVFITDGRAVSYAESFMGFIEGYKLATIVGQPTAGTNGNTNYFDIPGNYTVKWTGMKVVKHDGSQLHGIGILPNVYVEKTIEGIKNGRDEFLEKAIEVVKQ